MSCWSSPSRATPSRTCSPRADVLLSATQPEGSETLDKVVYEAGAAGVPVLSSNVALDEFLGGLPVRLRFARRDPADLARALLEIDAAGPEVRAEIGQELRRRVEAGHSVESWADAVLRELGPLHTRAPPRAEPESASTELPGRKGRFRRLVQ